MTHYYYENIYWRGTDLWLGFAGKKIFVAGGTGFYGSWFVGFLNFLKEQKGISLEVEFGSKSTGWLINDASTYTNFQRDSDYIINCAGYASANQSDDEITSQHVAGPISLASAMKKGSVMLHISSGIADNAFYVPSPYSDAKRAAEWFIRDMGVNVRIVRPFASVGPGMGLDKHFAISTFIRNKLEGKPLEVLEIPVFRSFVHIVDLMVQMFHVLMGESREPYQVGSDDKISMLDAAKLISDNISIVNHDFPTNACNDYVANLKRIGDDFNLGLDFSSKAAIMNTYNYYVAQPAALSHIGTFV